MRSRKKAQEYLGPQPATGRVGGKYLRSVAAAGRTGHTPVYTSPSWPGQASAGDGITESLMVQESCLWSHIWAGLTWPGRS